jgi:hypothetical protein
MTTTHVARIAGGLCFLVMIASAALGGIELPYAIDCRTLGWRPCEEAGAPRPFWPSGAPRNGNQRKGKRAEDYGRDGWRTTGRPLKSTSAQMSRRSRGPRLCYGFVLLPDGRRGLRRHGVSRHSRRSERRGIREAQRGACAAFLGMAVLVGRAYTGQDRQADDSGTNGSEAGDGLIPSFHGGGYEASDRQSP